MLQSAFPVSLEKKLTFYYMQISVNNNKYGYGMLSETAVNGLRA